MIVTQVNEPSEPQAKSGGVNSRVEAVKMKREGKKEYIVTNEDLK
jgi:hypothetical protein